MTTTVIYGKDRPGRLSTVALKGISRLAFKNHLSDHSLH